MEPIKAEKPETPYDHNFEGPGGDPFAVHDGPGVAGCWLEMKPLHGRKRTIGVVSEKAGGRVTNYLMYHDGGSMPSLVVLPQDDGTVPLQVVLPGNGSVMSRIKTVQLDGLYDAILEL